ncbi:MAG TPA: hypothetical protein VGL61_21255 [Kofleriaceae bacterium]
MTLVTGGGLGSIATKVLERRSKLAERAEDRRLIEHDRLRALYARVLTAAQDFRAIFHNLPADLRELDAPAAAHRRVCAELELELALPPSSDDIVQMFDDFCSFVGAAASETGYERERDLATADMAYKVLVRMLASDLEQRRAAPPSRFRRLVEPMPPPPNEH